MQKWKERRYMDKLLTISVAAYHVEDYLAETLDSFLIPQVDKQ